MFFKSGNPLHEHESGASARIQCPNCNNEGDFKLVWGKAGLGLGVPVVSWFTDALTVTTHKKWGIRCPTCNYAEEITKDVAKGLILKAEKKC